MDVIGFILGHPTEIIAVVTGLVAVANVVAQMTPSQTDNNIVAKIDQIVHFIALRWGNDKAPPAPPAA